MLVAYNDSYKAKKYLQRKLAFVDHFEREDRGTDKLSKHKMDVLPERNMIRTEINELIDSVHGAVIARLQLGFDEIEPRPWNLKPIIVNLRN